MKFIKVDVQGGWLRRTGLRGRWLTVYYHRYSGAERTERFHTHPWGLAFGIVLSGKFYEQFKCGGEILERRPGSIQFYKKDREHRIVSGRGRSLFFGLFRSQQFIPRAAEFQRREGYCHYTELIPDLYDKDLKYIRNEVKVMRDQKSRSKLSKEEQERRKPVPPESLVGALHDTVHDDDDDNNDEKEVSKSHATPSLPPLKARVSMTGGLK